MNNEISPKPANGIGYAKYLSPVDVWAIAFGCIIGWGSFVMPGTTFLPIAGPGGTVIAMIVSTAIMALIGRNYSFMMEKRPGTGGVYTYTKEAFGSDHAFICSWFLSLSYISVVFLNATALFVIGRTLFGDLFRIGTLYTIAGYDINLGEVALSALALLVIGLLFILKKPLLQWMQTVLAILLLLGSVTVAAAAIPHINASDVFTTMGTVNPVAGSFTIILLSPWAFVGFDIASLETAHFKYPAKKSGKVILISILCGGFVYAAMSLVSIAAVPEGFSGWREYIAALGTLNGVENVPTFFASQTYMGKAGLIVMGVTALAAILTGIIGAYRATTRMLSTMAEDNILSKKFSSTSFCILFIMLISVVVSFLGRNALDWFVELTTLGAIIGFGYTSAAAYKLAVKENVRSVKITGIAGAVISVAFASVHLIPKITVLNTMGAESFLMLSVWCLLGFIFYRRTMKRVVLTEHNGAAVSNSILFAFMLYSAIMWFILNVSDIVKGEKPASDLVIYSIVLIIIVALGFSVMLYIQRLIRERHETLERAKIHAEEGSLAKSRFLFNMSHDIRTPMNAIIGYTNIAKRENDSPQIDEYLSKIEASSGHLLDLINDILEMSRIESGKVELDISPADLTAITGSLRDVFETQMKEKEIEFTVNDSGVKHGFVMCDRKNINRILFNMVSNAYKFTPKGGKVSLTLNEYDAEKENAGSYEFRVKDNGIGMSKEFAEKVFNAFERERTSTVSGIQGTGLGMSIAKSLAELMGGTIEVVTEPGKGTEFIIRLEFEFAEKAKEAEDGKNVSPEDADFSGMRALVAEDNEINLEIATFILNDMGFETESAENGKEAVDIISASEPGYFDILLTDIQMPVMDGYTAAKAIRALENKALASVPIVAMTANAFREDEEAAINAGMQGHISKPLNVDDMKKTLASILKKN